MFLALWVPAIVLAFGPQAAFGDDTKKTESAKKVDAGKQIVPVFRLTGSVTESPADDTFSFGGATSVSLKDLVARMKKTVEDHAVKAVVLLDEGGTVGSAQKEELRQVMAQIRAANKEIYIHSDSLTMGDYVLLSGASRLSVVPTADLWVTGLHGEAPYLRGLLDMIGVKPDFLHCGDYKSAAEIFMREGPSPEAEKMQNWLLDSMYETYINLIAKGRGVDPAKVKAWIDGGPYTAEKAKAAGLVDAVEHRQDFEALLKSKYGKDVVFDKKYGKKQAPKLAFDNPFAVFKVMGDLLKDSQKTKNAKSTVGIVYVDGPIQLGSSHDSIFGAATVAMSSDIRKALNEAVRDDAIKAVVLRVDSPGGSAVASEIILDAARRVKAKKPFVVSMGDVAGSGGYYVACGSDLIFADESTITGSIGVVGGKLVTTPMWKKIGVTFKEYKRGANAGLLGTSEVFSPSERECIQTWMDDIYGVFKGHVKAIRGDRLKKPLDELAGGRVYTGRQALELGLVDKIGTLQDAIKYVAGEAKLSDYDVRVVPEPKNLLERLLEELSGDKEEKGAGVETRLPPGGQSVSLVDLALPYLQHVDPERVKLIKTALGRLQLMQREGVILMMPEIRIAP
jgi:protease-4